MPAAVDRCDLNYFENRVKFVCCEVVRKDYEKLEANLKKRLEVKLDRLSSITWSELVHMPKEKGLTPEYTGSDSYVKIVGRRLREHNKEDVYPFHIRITRKFRIFGYQYRDTFYIVIIDPNHQEHR